MAYTPTDWQTGDIITADKLNNMEDGIENALEKTGGTVTGNIVMSGDAELQGNAQTSTTFKMQNIPESSDLNNFTNYGFFAPVTGNIAQNVTNKPSDLSPTDAFCVFVFPWYGSVADKSTMQLLFSGTTSAVISMYIRGRYGNKWSNWSKVSTTSVASTEAAMAAAYREGVESIA